jgi:hypothetical protein
MGVLEDAPAKMVQEGTAAQEDVVEVLILIAHTEQNTILIIMVIVKLEAIQIGIQILVVSRGLMVPLAIQETLRCSLEEMETKVPLNSSSSILKDL